MIIIIILTHLCEFVLYKQLKAFLYGVGTSLSSSHVMLTLVFPCRHCNASCLRKKHEYRSKRNPLTSQNLSIIHNRVRPKSN